jgi:hypothetical protein
MEQMEARLAMENEIERLQFLVKEFGKRLGVSERSIEQLLGDNESDEESGPPTPSIEVIQHWLSTIDATSQSNGAYSERYSSYYSPACNTKWDSGRCSPSASTFSSSRSQSQASSLSSATSLGSNIHYDSSRPQSENENRGRSDSVSVLGQPGGIDMYAKMLPHLGLLQQPQGD